MNPQPIEHLVKQARIGPALRGRDENEGFGIDAPFRVELGCASHAERRPLLPEQIEQRVAKLRLKLVGDLGMAKLGEQVCDRGRYFKNTPIACFKYHIMPVCQSRVRRFDHVLNYDQLIILFWIG